MTTAIILAGGEGTRLRPLTFTTPKALIDINGKTLTERVFEILKKFEITDIVLSVAYLADKVQDYFKDGSDFGMNIRYAVENAPMGTAGPFMMIPKLESTFLCINGDDIFDVDIKKAIKQHKETGATVTIMLTRVDNPSSFGVARLDKNKILEFVEKPAPGTEPSNLINSGYYVMEPEVFDIVNSLNKDFVMLEKDVFPKLAKEGKLFAFPSDGKWFDTGTKERWEEVKRKWKGPTAGGQQ